MQKIEKENKRLKNILPKNYSRPELDKRRLGEIKDFEDKIKILSEELGSCFKESRKLEKSIKEKLESIGYGI